VRLSRSNLPSWNRKPITVIATTQQPTNTSGLLRGLLRIFFSVIACVLLSSILISPASFAAKDEREQLQSVKNAINSLQQELAEDKSKKSVLQKQLQTVEQEINSVSKNISAKDLLIADLSNKVTQLNQELTELESAKKQQNQIILNYIRNAYETDQQNTLQLILSQEKPEELARLMQYYRYLHGARHKKIDEYRKMIEQINTIKPQIENTHIQLVSEKKSLEQKHHDQLNLHSKRKTLIARLDSAIQNKDEKLKTLQADRDRLAKVIRALEEAIAKMQTKMPENHTQFQRGKKNMPWPLKGTIANTFGGWRQPGLMRWDGIFIEAVEGTQVRPVHQGRVVFADWLRGHGLLIIVDHGDQYLSLYAHNQSLIKSTGDWVTPQDIIATAGNSGGQSRSGIYFEIRHKGQPTDPLQWCCG